MPSLSKEYIMIMTKKPAFIIDLDDTLVYCGVHYQETRRKLYGYMAGLGMPEKEAEYKFNWLELHRRMNPNLSYQHYFPENMVKLYREWCVEKQQSAVPDIEQELKAIGYSVYQSDFGPLPGAHEMLQELNKDYVLYLYSKGETEIQIQKILRAQLDSYFTGVWITNKKTVKILTKFMLENKLNIKTTWAMGNSRAEDILPARELGIPAHQLIWVETYEWEKDHAPLPEGVLRVHDLAEVVPLTSKIVVPI